MRQIFPHLDYKRYVKNNLTFVADIFAMAYSSPPPRLKNIYMSKNAIFSSFIQISIFWNDKFQKIPSIFPPLEYIYFLCRQGFCSWHVPLAYMSAKNVIALLPIFYTIFNKCKILVLPLLILFNRLLIKSYFVNCQINQLPIKQLVDETRKI